MRMNEWTCIRFLRSTMSRICFTLFTNKGLCFWFDLAASAWKSFIFFCFVAVHAHMHVRGAAAIAAWKCCGFWRSRGRTILSGISVGQLSAKFPQTFLSKAMALVTVEVQDHKETQHGDRSPETNWKCCKRMKVNLKRTVIKSIIHIYSILTACFTCCLKFLKILFHTL